MSDAPPIQRLEHWTLVSTDIERTRQFYVDVLGAKPPEGRPPGGPASVELAGTLIDFFPASDAWAPSPGSGGQHHAYIIGLDAYDEWVEHFKAKGVPARLTTHGFNRMSIYVDDPDGYHIELTTVLANRDTAREEFEKRGLEVNWFQMNGGPEQA